MSDESVEALEKGYYHLQHQLSHCKCRYLCERCGGSGKQEDGSYNLETKSYTGAAGQCQLCNGEGYLGYLPTNCIPRSELPRLPDFGYVLPFRKFGCAVVDANGMMMQDAEFLASLLNAAYPEGQGS